MRHFFICLSFLATAFSSIKAQPNIVWLVCEDSSPTFSFYGDKTARTPALDQLAAEAVVFRNAFATVAVCGPSRSAIITGMYPTSIGTMHMRTGKDGSSWGRREYAETTEGKDMAGKPIREYAAVPPPTVRCFTEYLRTAGYFCTNNAKTDYQFAAPVTAWDQNNAQAHWKNRAPGQPFFAVFNFGETHESKLWEHASKPLTVQPDKVPVPPYLPDNEATRQTIARHYSNLELMDAQVAKIIQQLKADSLYDETIIFFYSDHGGPLPHQKRETSDNGLRIPLLVKMPLSQKQKSSTDLLVSLVDLAPTVISLAGFEPPSNMQGRAFLGEYVATPNQYVFASGDRFDEFTDRVRAVRTNRFLYVRNDCPYLPKYKDVAYRKKIPMMQNMLELRQQKKLNAIQVAWFEPKPAEELYDASIDPHNINNLAQNPAYASLVDSLGKVLQSHADSLGDWGNMGERAMIEWMWPGMAQPITATPTIEQNAGTITLGCTTEGSRIGYRWADSPNQAFDPAAGWQVYAAPLGKNTNKKYLYIVAERLGYKTSEQQVVLIE